MKNRALSTLFVLAGSALLVPLGAPTASATPTISITSPASGTVVSRAATPKIAVAGTATFAPPVAATRSFFLRRDDCGGSSDNPHLSVEAGGDGGDGCGNLIGGVSAGTTTYPAVDGLPVTVDTTRPAHATITVESFSGFGGLGNQQVTTKLTGKVGGTTKTLGSASKTILVTPPTDQYTYDIDIPLTNPGGPITTLTLTLTIGGGVQHGHVVLNGASFVNMPFLDPGAIQVFSDEGDFANATIQPDGTWSASLTTPSFIGNHTITAQATQGEEAVYSDPVQITVTA